MKAQTADVERAVSECTRYWKRTDVPRDRIVEMRAELEAHLREAVSEGRTVESVVGRDPSEFAEEWAREYRPAMMVGSRRRAWGPALLAFLAGMYTLWVSLMIPVFSSSEAVICCPRRVLESETEVDRTALAFAIAILAVAVLSLVAAVLLALGRLTGASVTLGVATVVAAFSPFTWITGLALLGCFVWTQWFRRRRAGVTAPGI
jgi:hypothetical protein